MVVQISIYINKKQKFFFSALNFTSLVDPISYIHTDRGNLKRQLQSELYSEENKLPFITIEKKRNLRIIRGEDMTISVSTTLLEPYNSYEFRNLPKESFKGAATDFSRFPTGLDSEERLKELKLAILESVFKELDRIDHAIFLDFDNKNIQKREYHGEITYIKKSDLTINYRGKIIFLKKIRFIKHMSRSNHDTSIFEFRVDLREDLINKSIPEFTELRNFLEKRSVAFRGLFLTGNNPVPNRGTNRFITETVNKYFLCFFEKGVTNENRYSEAFETIRVTKFELLLAVHVSKGDELNVDKPECF